MSFRGAPRLNFGRDELIEMGRRNRAERTQEEAVRRRAQRAQSQEGKERRAIETETTE